jgi:hypothetical protein
LRAAASNAEKFGLVAQYVISGGRDAPCTSNVYACSGYECGSTKKRYILGVLFKASCRNLAEIFLQAERQKVGKELK